MTNQRNVRDIAQLLTERGIDPELANQLANKYPNSLGTIKLWEIKGTNSPGILVHMIRSGEGERFKLPTEREPLAKSKRKDGRVDTSKPMHERMGVSPGWLKCFRCGRKFDYANRKNNDPGASCDGCKASGVGGFDLKRRRKVTSPDDGGSR